MVLKPGELILLCRGRHLLTLAALALLAYFAWHGVHGRYGLLAWREYAQEFASRQATLTRLEEKRLALEHRVEGLRGRIDPDLLDEQARRTYSLVGPLDVIILLEDLDQDEVTNSLDD